MMVGLFSKCKSIVKIVFENVDIFGFWPAFGSNVQLWDVRYKKKSAVKVICMCANTN